MPGELEGKETYSFLYNILSCRRVSPVLLKPSLPSIHSPFLPGHESPESQLESCSLKRFSLLVPRDHLIKVWPVSLLGLPSDSVVKNLPARGDTGSVPGWGGSPGGGNGSPVQCSCLESPMDRGAWRATAHGSEELDTPERALRGHP